MLRTQQKSAEFIRHRETLRSYATTRVKTSNIGGDTETGFEQSFASLAFSYLSDKAPRLLDYLIGFQLVDRNDDNTKAMGIFGFKIGEQWVYAPVFFLNGDLKGHELLYLKDQDRFVPLKENWINYLLSKRPSVLGNGTPGTSRQLGTMQPDLQMFSQHPQQGGKTASVRIPRGNFKEFLPVFAATVTNNPMRLQKFAGLTDRLDLRSVLKSDVRFVKAALQICQQYPMVEQQLKNFYGDNLLRDSLLSIKAAAQSSFSILAPAKSIIVIPKQASILDPAPEAVKAAATRKALKIATELETFEGKTLFSDPDKEKILRDGYLIEDERDDDSVSKAYNTQIEVKLQNPDETGIYEVLTKQGTFERCLVVLHPHNNMGRTNICTVLKIGSNNWLNADPTVVWTKSADTTEEYRKWLADQSSKSSLKKKGYYLALSSTGQGSAPFRVYEDLGENLYDVGFRDTADYKYTRPSGAPKILQDSQYSSGESVQIGARKGSRLRSHNGTLYVPEDNVVLTLREPTDDADEYSCCNSDSMSADPPIQPGDLVDLQTFILQKTAMLKIYTDHHEFYVGGQNPLSKVAALIHLVRDHGFRESSAKSMLQLAEKKGSMRFRVKYADPYNMQDQTFSAPAQQEPQYGYDQAYGGVQTQQPMEQTQQVPELSASNTDPSTYDIRPDAQPDQGAMQSAQQAGQKGQKEVFDTAILGSMLKAVREDSLVDRYMGDLMKALDRLGRILFLFFWHAEEFQDRYGKQDMPELEDTLRNAFDVVGDLVLFLTQKSIDADPSMMLSDPDLDNSARN